MTRALYPLALLLALAPAGRSQDLCGLDKAKMIPIRTASQRTYQYTAAVTGSAIKGDQPFLIHFDTGSWTTSIPASALDFSQLRVIQTDVTTDWGRAADLVEGQLTLLSTDGTPYSIDDYRFYALKGDDGAIMGSFPSRYLHRAEQSLPFLLAQKYAADRMGLGIVSTCAPTAQGLAAGWSQTDSYLLIGNHPEVSDYLAWRSDIPNWTSDPDGFYPEAVPGFQVEVAVPGTAERIVTANDLIATVDTGAPDLTLRLTPDDPQYAAPFASHFVADGPWRDWGNPNYNEHATTLVDGTVTVRFTGDDGASQSYRFDVPSDPQAARQAPASLFAGRWGGGVPWTYREPGFPRNRINLGNSVYFFWPVYHWDIANKRVGIGTRATGAPALSASAPSITARVGPGETATETFSLANTAPAGSRALQWEASLANVSVPEGGRRAETCQGRQTVAQRAFSGGPPYLQSTLPDGGAMRGAGQSFVAPCTGRLSDVTLQVYGTPFAGEAWAGTLTVHAGTGPVGNALATVPVTGTNAAGTTPLTVSLGSGVEVTAGQTYTLYLDATSGRTAVQWIRPGPYAEGTAYLGRSPGSAIPVDADLAFEAAFEGPTWISVSPVAGAAEPGGSSALSVSFDAAGLPDGTYTADLVLATNVPDAPTLTVPVSLTVGATVDSETGPDDADRLGAPSPNPVRGIVTLPYTIPATGPVRLSVYDLLGREVAVVVSGVRPQGSQEAQFETSALPPGIYVVRLASGDSVDSQRLTVIR